ncbi:MAG: DUF1015 domain-containing protein [Phycisphaeraceae bacterium]
MPQLQPIHAIRFSTADGDISSKIAPPYDVLDEGPKQALLSKDPHNIVKIDLPVTPPKTVGPDTAYNEAGQTMRQWLDEGVLTRDEAPAIFPYEQVYTVSGKQLRRRGLFAALKAEEFNRKGGGVHRHELTIKGGVDDRTKLMYATEAQLSPVFGIFSDPQGEVVAALSDHFDGREPDFHGKTPDDGVEHRVWVVKDEATIAKMQAFFEPTDVFIADGHHRYTTALEYAKAHPDKQQASNCLFVLVASEDPGMIVLPTHRIVCGLESFSMDKLKAAIEQRSEMELVPVKEGADQLDALEAKLPEAGAHAMGLYDPASGQCYLLTYTDDPLAQLAPDKPEVWRQLDVAVVHELLIDRVLKPQFGGENVTFKYTAELGEVRQQAEADGGRLGVVMQATPLASVMGVSLADEVMPPKSTFFYPKLATGLVVNPLG